MTLVSCDRLPRPDDTPRRDVKESRYCPDTQAERDRLALAFRKGERAYHFLMAFYKHWKEVPADWQREIADQFPSHVPLADIIEPDIDKFNATLDEMDAGLVEWEQRNG